MGNPKERKECPICGKTLYDRSTWNRHMRIHTGKLDRFNGFVKKSDNVRAVDSTKYTWGSRYIWSGNPYWRERLSTVDLLVLRSRSPLQTLFYAFAFLAFLFQVKSLTRADFAAADSVPTTTSWGTRRSARTGTPGPWYPCHKIQALALATPPTARKQLALLRRRHLLDRQLAPLISTKLFRLKLFLIIPPTPHPVACPISLLTVVMYAVVC